MRDGAYTPHVWASWGKLESRYNALDKEPIVVTFDPPPDNRMFVIWRFEIVARPVDVEVMDADCMKQWYRDSLGTIWTVHATGDSASATVAWPIGSACIELDRAMIVAATDLPCVTVLLPPRWVGSSLGWQIGCILSGYWTTPPTVPEVSDDATRT